MGEFNSSITRVRPFFQSCFASVDASWLSRLLRCATEQRTFAEKLANDPGKILPPLLLTRDYPDRILKSYGIESITLEACFEMKVPPPTRFLRWLIENPEKLADCESTGEFTALRRAQLKCADSDVRRRAMSEALAELGKSGRARSARRWWAFEGFSEVDCYIETDRLILLVEGKRTDVLSEKTSWYEGRNQLVRNLEIAQEEASARVPAKEFAVIVMSEDATTFPQTAVESSLPHFSANERAQLMQHFLGCVTWRNASETLGLDYTALPKTVAEYVESIRQSES